MEKDGPPNTVLTIRTSEAAKHEPHVPINTRGVSGPKIPCRLCGIDRAAMLEALHEVLIGTTQDMFWLGGSSCVNPVSG